MKSQLEDFKEECAKSKTTQLNKINLLESQIKELQKSKDNGPNVWKVRGIHALLPGRRPAVGFNFWDEKNVENSQKRS